VATNASASGGLNAIKMRQSHDCAGRLEGGSTAQSAG